MTKRERERWTSQQHRSPSGVSLWDIWLRCLNLPFIYCCDRKLNFTRAAKWTFDSTIHNLMGILEMPQTYSCSHQCAQQTGLGSWADAGLHQAANRSGSWNSLSRTKMQEGFSSIWSHHCVTGFLNQGSLKEKKNNNTWRQNNLTVLFSLWPFRRSQWRLSLPGRVSHPGPLWPLLDAPRPRPGPCQVTRACPQRYCFVYRGHHGGRASLRGWHHQENFCHLRQGWARGRGAGRFKGEADSGVSGV